MRYRDFLGRKTSVICMGAGGYGFSMSQMKTNEFLDAFAAMGGNFIDTARIYGDIAGGVGGISERAVGNWVAARKNRESLVIGTKGGHPLVETMNVGRLDKENLTYDIEKSLDDLMMDYIDIYWLHRDDVTRPVGDIIETLNGFIEKGYARAIGTSNWTPARIREANEYAKAHGMVGFAANQPQFSLARQDLVEDPTLCQMDAEMYAFHKETQMPCVPFSSQAKGFFAKWHENGENGMPDKAKRRFMTDDNMAIYEKLVKLSAETGYSISALSVAYLTCNEFDVFPICGVSKMEQVMALAESGDAVITLEQALNLRSF